MVHPKYSHCIGLHTVIPALNLLHFVVLLIRLIKMFEQVATLDAFVHLFSSRRTLKAEQIYRRSLSNYNGGCPDL